MLERRDHIHSPESYAPTSRPDPVHESARLEAPRIYDLSKLASNLERNEQITRWYHETDVVLSKFLGQPDVPTWARFAKYASYNAGVQLRNIEEGIQVLTSLAVANVQCRSGLAQLDIAQFTRGVRAGMDCFREIMDLLKHDGLAGEALIYSLSESGISDTDRQRLAGTLGRDCPRSWMTRGFVLLKNLPTFLGSLDTVLSSLEEIHGRVGAANQAIYDFMAPKLAGFLQDGYTARPSNPSSERASNTERFFDRALFLYARARELGVQAEALPIASLERAETLELRRSLVHRGNVLATFGEQVFRAQPQLEHVSQFIDRSTRFMRLSFPGTRFTFGAPITGERRWSQVYDRMGIDSNEAPADPCDVCEERFVPFFRPSDPRFIGTIGHLLLLGKDDPALATALRTAPPPIAAAIDH